MKSTNCLRGHPVMGCLLAAGLYGQPVAALGQHDYLDILDSYARDIEMAVPSQQPSSADNLIGFEGTLSNGKTLGVQPLRHGVVADGQHLSQAEFNRRLTLHHPASYALYEVLAPYEKKRVYRAFLRTGDFDQALRAIRSTIQTHHHTL